MEKPSSSLNNDISNLVDDYVVTNKFPISTISPDNDYKDNAQDGSPKLN